MTTLRTPIEPMFDGIEWKPMPPGEAPPPDDGIPYATHEGTLSFGEGVTLRVCQLSNGQRVIDAADLARFFGWDAPEETP